MPPFLSRIPFSALLLSAVLIVFSVSNGSFVFWNQQQIALIEVAFALWVIFQEKFDQMHWRPQQGVAVVWILWIALATFYAQHHFIDSSATWTRFLQEVFHLLFGWAVWRICLRQNHKIMAYAMVTGIVIGALINLGTIIYRWHILPDPRTAGWTTGLPLFVNIRHLGYLASAAVVAQCFIFLRANSCKARISHGVLFTLLLAFLCWTGGRAVIGGVFLTAIAMMWLGQFSWRRNLSVVITVPIAIFLAQYFAVQDESLGLFSAWDRSVHATQVDGFLSGRWIVWTDAWHHILQHPWLGFGADGYIAIRPPFAIDGGILHPHNVFVQSLVEWGFIGTGIFILMFFYMLKPVVRNLCEHYKAQTIQSALLLGGALTGNLLLLSLTEGIFYHGIGTSLLAAAMGLALSACDRSL